MKNHVYENHSQPFNSDRSEVSGEEIFVLVAASECRSLLIHMK